MSDHADSEYGYAHYTLSVERAPGVDTELLFDRLVDVVGEACNAAKGDPSDVTCAIEHHESMTTVACLFPEDGEPGVQHLAS